jgi:hemoglobin
MSGDAGAFSRDRQSHFPFGSIGLVLQALVKKRKQLMTERVSAYELIGGEPGVRKLVDRFYDLMDELDGVKELRAMHAANLKGSREKLFLFLSGWLGGPDLYTQKYGHPRLRARHMPFSIGVTERDQWMLCMNRAMQETGMDENLRQALGEALGKTADFMRNRPEPESEKA